MKIVKNKKSVIGGEFLLNDINYNDVFIPEDFDEDQRMMEEAESNADAPMERQARRSGGYMMDDVREETILSNDPEKTYDLNKAEVEDTEKRKEIFQKYMGEFNETIFSLLNNKLIGEKMSEQLDVMKYLAGLLNEAPPVNFDADVDTGMTNDDDDEYATKPGYGGSP